MESLRPLEFVDRQMISTEIVRLRLVPQNLRLATARKYRGYTQKELANMVGCSMLTISKIESMRSPSRPVLRQKIAGVLGMPVELLFPGPLIGAISSGLFKKQKDLNDEQVLNLYLDQVDKNLSSSGEDDIIAECDRNLLPVAVSKAMSDLTPVEKTFLTKRFGLDGGDSMSCKEIGEEWGRSNARMHQIEAKALRKLRHPSRSRILKAFL